MKSTFLLGVFGLLVADRNACFAQCKETVSPSNNKKVHYHIVPLSGAKEYLTLTKTGEERVLNYHNDEFGQVYHVQMFTEIKFSSVKGNFSLYTTISSTDRSNWQSEFVLSTPVEPKELEKMKGTAQIEILLPDDKRVFKIDPKKNQLLHKAIACMH
ncbi:hypothetical protein [Dyadobacter soli]|nr:hypothetical protein [Dyadobacter soli]